MLCFVLGALLSGCGGAAGTSTGTLSSLIGAWMLIASVAGLLTGCGGGSGNGNFDAGSAASTSTTTTTTTTGNNTVTPTPTPNPTPAAATRLAFLNQPATRAVKATSQSQALTPITPALQVAIEDANGNVVTTATNPVTISFGTNPGNATLSGTLTVNAVKGIATFSNILISRAASGYTLIATAQGLTSGTSAVFTVAPLANGWLQRAELQYTNGLEYVQVADVNGDGHPDLVGVSTAGPAVVVYLGNGDGTYAAPIATSVGHTPSSLAVGDFNNDGKLDLAVSDTYTSGVNVLLGTGTVPSRPRCATCPAPP